MDYQAYTVQIGSKPSYFGTDDFAESSKMLDNLAQGIKAKFPGIALIVCWDAPFVLSDGPDQDQADMITGWIYRNWNHLT